MSASKTLDETQWQPPGRNTLDRVGGPTCHYFCPAPTARVAMRGKVQKMTLEDGKTPKGLQRVLEEHGFDTKGTRAKCSRCARGRILTAAWRGSLANSPTSPIRSRCSRKSSRTPGIFAYSSPSSIVNSTRLRWYVTFLCIKTLTLRSHIIL